MSVLRYSIITFREISQNPQLIDKINGNSAIWINEFVVIICAIRKRK